MIAELIALWRTLSTSILISHRAFIYFPPPKWRRKAKKLRVTLAAVARAHVTRSQWPPSSFTWHHLPLFPEKRSSRRQGLGRMFCHDQFGAVHGLPSLPHCKAATELKSPSVTGFRRWTAWLSEVIPPICSLSAVSVLPWWLTVAHQQRTLLRWSVDLTEDSARLNREAPCN